VYSNGMTSFSGVYLNLIKDCGSRSFAKSWLMTPSTIGPLRLSLFRDCHCNSNLIRMLNSNNKKKNMETIGFMRLAAHPVPFRGLSHPEDQFQSQPMRL